MQRVTLLLALTAMLGLLSRDSLGCNGRGGGPSGGFPGGFSRFGGFGGGTFGFNPGLTNFAQAQMAYAVAQRNHEIYRAQRQENRRRQLENRVARRAERDSYEREHPKTHRTAEQIANASRSRLPKRLKSEAYQVGVGKIAWPAALATADFAESRERIDALFAERTSANSGLGSENCNEIREVSDEMHRQLAKRINEMRPDEYVAARKLLDSVRYEARFAADDPAVASN